MTKTNRERNHVLDEVKENRKDWRDVPANKMTVVQLREAVKELRKELATIKGL